MIYNINKIKKKNLELYNRKTIDIAREFASKLYKEMSDIIKVTALFGSSARKVSKTNDIDILVVVDDVTIQWTLDLVETYRLIVEKIVADTAPEELHITTMKLTSFWDYLRNGDAIAINILRDGVSLIDHDMFDPLQALLLQGRIRPSIESIFVYYGRAPRTLNNAKWHIMQAIQDLYWAVIDASHAALMTQNVIPPSPEHVSDMMNEILINKGLLDKSYANTMEFFYDMTKKIERKEIRFISGKEFDKYLKRAQEFVMGIDQFISKQLNIKP